MNPEELKDVLRRVPEAPVAFPYRKDDFALQLLKLAVGGGRSIRVLRKSPFAKLLDRPRVKEILRRRGDGRIEQSDFGSADSKGAVDFTLTWGRWGHTSRQMWDRGWHQMARRGLNLVVQLNLPETHVRDYRRLVKPGPNHPFEVAFHPVAHDGHITLAWSRIDLNLESREALIEEIQSDWVREAAQSISGGQGLHGAHGRPEKIETYVRHVLAPLGAIWDEAVLAATIAVLYGPLGIKNIYYYDHETSHLTKGGCPEHSDTTGPRSLYVDLPKKMCFQRVGVPPRFLDRTFRTALCTVFSETDPVFWRLPLPESA